MSGHVRTQTQKHALETRCRHGRTLGLARRRHTQKSGTCGPHQSPPQAKPTLERIGDVLRQARLDKNDDLYLIADYLRIKPAFLIALENSQYDEFPADAYVIGFLRTYANFLGVDGKDAVDRYRYEMAGRRKKPVLSMPTPVSGGRTPSAVIMVGATIAVLLIYAVWYSISSANRTEVNVQPPLPTVAQSATTTSSSDSNGGGGLTAPLAPATTTTNSPASTAPSVAAPNMPPVAPGIVVTTEQPQPTSLLPETKDAKKQVYGDPQRFPGSLSAQRKAVGLWSPTIPAKRFSIM